MATEIRKNKKKFADTYFMIGVRGIGLLLFLLYMFMRIGLSLLWNRVFNKQKYYQMCWEIDRW